jgi:hypothetical protein
VHAWTSKFPSPLPTSVKKPKRLVDSAKTKKTIHPNIKLASLEKEKGRVGKSRVSRRLVKKSYKTTTTTK